MTEFDSIFAAAAFPTHVEHFGESIVYRPRNGAPRRMRAIVDRHPPEPLKDVSQGGVQRRLIVEVQNCSIHGIDSGRLDSGGDQVDVAQVKGGSVSCRSIARLLSDKGGITKFEVR